MSKTRLDKRSASNKRDLGCHQRFNHNERLFLHIDHAWRGGKQLFTYCTWQSPFIFIAAVHRARIAGMPSSTNEIAPSNLEACSTIAFKLYWQWQSKESFAIESMRRNFTKEEQACIALR